MRCIAKIVKSNLLLFSIFTISAFAAQEFTFVAETNSAQFYVDTLSIKKIGSKRKAWIIQDRSKADNKGFLSYYGLEEFDCINEKSRLLSMTRYIQHMASGENDGQTSIDGQWGHIPPGTSLELVFNFVCNK